MEIDVLVYCLLGVAFLLVIFIILSNSKVAAIFSLKDKKDILNWSVQSHLKLDSGTQVSLLEFNKEISLIEAVIFLREDLKEVALSKDEIEESAKKFLIVKGSSFFALEKQNQEDVYVYYYGVSPFNKKIDSRIADIDEVLCINCDYFLVPSVL